MTISERIRLARQKKGITQNELAVKSGINNKSISRYELGSSTPPADAIKAIADALGVSTDYLLSDKDNITIKDKDLFEKFEIIQEMTGEVKKTIINLIDLAIRDYKTGQTYLNR